MDQGLHRVLLADRLLLDQDGLVLRVGGQQLAARSPARAQSRPRQAERVAEQAGRLHQRFLHGIGADDPEALAPFLKHRDDTGVEGRLLLHGTGDVGDVGDQRRGRTGPFAGSLDLPAGAFEVTTRMARPRSASADRYPGMRQMTRNAPVSTKAAGSVAG